MMRSEVWSVCSNLFENYFFVSWILFHFKILKQLRCINANLINEEEIELEDKVRRIDLLEMFWYNPHKKKKTTTIKTNPKQKKTKDPPPKKKATTPPLPPKMTKQNKDLLKSNNKIYVIIKIIFLRNSSQLESEICNLITEEYIDFKFCTKKQQRHKETNQNECLIMTNTVFLK